MRKKALAVVAVVSAALLGSAPGARAHGPQHGERLSDLKTMSEEANLVFTGEVVDLKYKKAKIQGTEDTIPMTLVTYSIGEVVRGKKPGETFTMRFPGGADGQGGFVEASGVPKFQPGDKDVLFVKGNGESGCPLVECEWGRFRVHEKTVHNTHGVPVGALGKSRAIARGKPAKKFQTFSFPAPAFDDLMQNPEARKIVESKKMDLEEARAKYEKEAPKWIKVEMGLPRAARGAKGDELESEEETKGEKGEKAERELAVSEDPKKAERSPREESAKSLSEQKISEMKLIDPSIGAEGADDPKVAELKLRDPDLKATGKPVGLEDFLAEVRASAAKAKAPKQEVLRSFDSKAELVLQFTGAKGPGKEQLAGEKERPGVVGAPTAEDEAEMKALKSQEFNPVLKEKR